MHLLQPEFEIPRDEAIDFAARRGFGMLTAFDGTGPIGSHLPFVLKGGVVQAHVTRANPLAALADGRVFLLAVAGPDAYISNDWYATPDNVSTWLYEAVHLSGPARRQEPGANRAHGDALLAAAEARVAPKPPWGLAAMEAVKREAMLAHIVTIEIAITRVEGQRKHNQLKPDADHLAIVRRLESRGEPNGIAIAAKMRAARPQLDYESRDEVPA
ncbi:FMN-binding negative transcriptional regulator [Roseococcus sp. SYP-B2431]|uniref:FMN-binding negative transcriptional regulator n=1 Tax=Roseococcus sp. SYP-B2431 TaxID=2496640 RepID=UPI00103DB3F2|nr:FMN-binding negative transcriptional regulator [Roseococcus sp. SYP-B2431]TCH98771.1 FMN-binding negative transcriptional regulator [Roseococcus sp. SYP-B2431]